MKAKYVIFPLVALLLVFSTVGSAFADDPNASADFFITYLEPEEVFLGKGGVFMPSSGYTAVATINRWDPYGIRHQGLRFVERWIEFRIFDLNTEPFNFLLGVNYVYFNLNATQREMWDSGDLSIYYLNEATSKWEECPTFLVANENPRSGRVTCVMPGFGYYGLARVNN